MNLPDSMKRAMARQAEPAPGTTDYTVHGSPGVTGR